MKEVRITQVEPGRLDIAAPFECANMCRSLVDRRWEANNKKNPRKRWSIPATAAAAEEAFTVFGEAGYQLVMDDVTTGLLKQAYELQQTSVYKTATDLPEIPGRYCKCATPKPGDIEQMQNPLLCYNDGCGRAIRSMGHQRQAYWFGVERDNTFLSMGMGTGKSKVTVALLDGWNAMSGYILCPRRAVPVWPEEFAIHSERNWLVIAPPQKATVLKRASYIQRQIALAESQNRPWVVCVNTEASWRPEMAMTLKDNMVDVMIVDESHRIKSPGGKASKFIATLRKFAKRSLFLTGTAMPHSPLDIFAQYRAMDPSVFGTNFHRFRRRYAVLEQVPGAPVGALRVAQDENGKPMYQNEEELNRKWGAHAYICGEEVLDLPPYSHRQLYTDLEPKARKYYDRFDRDFIVGVKDAADDDKFITADNALTKLLRLQQMTSGWVREEDGEMVQVSTAKKDLLADVMEDFAQREPIMVVCRFQSDLDAVKDICEQQDRRYGEISGRVNESSPIYGLKGRNMREDIDVVAVQIQAGGVGIDLTRAAYCIFYSVGYSLGDYDQVTKRIHRPGQVRHVQYLHLIVRNTKDEAVYEALAQRRDVVDFMIDMARKS